VPLSSHSVIRPFSYCLSSFPFSSLPFVSFISHSLPFFLSFFLFSLILPSFLPSFLPFFLSSFSLPFLYLYFFFSPCFFVYFPPFSFLFLFTPLLPPSLSSPLYSFVFKRDPLSAMFKGKYPQDAWSYKMSQYFSLHPSSSALDFNINSYSRFRPAV